METLHRPGGSESRLGSEPRALPPTPAASATPSRPVDAPPSGVAAPIEPSRALAVMARTALLVLAAFLLVYALLPALLARA